jgi:hypothetical protein
VSCQCVKCGGITGSHRLCLCCRGQMARKCYDCRCDLPQEYYDYLCESCGREQGIEHQIRAAERKRRAQALRTCDDCGGWMYADEGPVCSLCQWFRTRAPISSE